jgi:ABC-2 type transport system ATP-binding protein
VHPSGSGLAIRARGLEKTYDGKVEAVRGIDLEVAIGECFGLLGPNGAGKTTTIEMLEGLLEPTSGEIEILGRRWGEDDESIRQRLGISLQETRLAEKLTVRETLGIFQSFYSRRRDVDELLERLGLEDKRDSWVDKLSGGQKQRLAVACALVGEPELLFLDEPTTGLDPQSRRHLWDRIRELRAEGRSVLLTTHYMEEAERLCDRVAIVDKGRVIAEDSPRELIAELGGEQVVEFAVAGPDSLDPRELEELVSVRGVHREGNGVFLLTVSEAHRALPDLVAYLGGKKARLEHLTTRQASLEDVFVSLTGRHLRDE